LTVNTVSSVFPLCFLCVSSVACFFCGLFSPEAGAFADLKNPLLHHKRAFC
jgi:hypothetical protein